jgi:hypothetical protein
MKLFRWISDNILFVITLFLLVFIPLYPKLPLLDLQHTWVYIRLEDFIILIVGIIFLIQLIRKKAYIRTPLTIPIVIFWAVGALSTIYAVLFIFPDLENVFPNLAFLHYLRRIEYMSLFFIGFSAVVGRKDIRPLIAVISLTLFAVFLYGLGQRYFGFPALSYNE